MNITLQFQNKHLNQDAPLLITKYSILLHSFDQEQYVDFLNSFLQEQYYLLVNNFKENNNRDYNSVTQSNSQPEWIIQTNSPREWHNDKALMILHPGPVQL